MCTHNRELQGKGQGEKCVHVAIAFQAELIEYFLK